MQIVRKTFAKSSASANQILEWSMTQKEPKKPEKMANAQIVQ